MRFVVLGQWSCGCIQSCVSATTCPSKYIVFVFVKYFCICGCIQICYLQPLIPANCTLRVFLVVVDKPSVWSSPSTWKMKRGKVGLKTKKKIKRLNPQCLSPTPNYTEDIHENLKIFDKLFSEFEFSYVSCMVHVKTVKGKNPSFT